MPLCLIVLALAFMQVDAPSAQQVKRPQPEPTTPAPRPHLSAEAFQRAFEKAFDAGDTDRIEQLVRENPMEFVPLFQRCTRVWIERSGQSGEREERAMAKARLIAETADKILEAPGVLEVLERVESFSDADRDEWRRAVAAHDRGVALLNAFRWREALDPLEGACKTFEQLGDAVRLGAGLSNRALCYRALGQLERAPELLTRALEMFNTIGNPLDIAISLGDLGNCYESLGQYEKAIELHTHALEMFDDLGNRQAIAIGLNNLGCCYEPLGQYEKAIELHTRALEINEELGNRRSISLSLGNLGNCYHDLGQYQKAIGYQTRALEIDETTGNPRDIVASLTNMSMSYRKLGQYEKAIELDTRALDLAEKIGNPQDIAGSLTNMSNCYSKLGRYQKSIELSLRALELRQKIGNPKDIAISLLNLAIGYESIGQNASSLFSLEQCAAALDRVGRRSLAEEGRAAFTTPWLGALPLICRTAHGLEETDALTRGFPLVEAFLSRTLLEGLQERAEDLVAVEDPEVGRERTSIMNRMVDLRLALGRELVRNGVDSVGSEELRLEIARQESVFVDAERRLRAKNPRLAELVAPRPASLAQVQAVLASDETILLFVLGAEQSYVWVLTSKSAALVPLAPERTIRTSFDELMKALSPSDKGQQRLDASFIAPSRELFTELLAPVADLIATANHLIIVPIDFLGLLPFEVLLTRDSKEHAVAHLEQLPYLLHAKTVQYAPSGSFLVWARERALVQRHWRKDICLFGDAIYEEMRGSTRARAIPDAAALPRLAATRGEVLAIAESRIGEDELGLFLEMRKLPRSGHVSGARFDLYLGSEASRENLQADLCGYRIVHLAAHGFFDEQFPWFSGLVLSSEEPHARILNLVDIAALKLEAEIVFLSACETARGKMLGSDGIKTAARSFVLAGAQSVVATQWNVIDDAAAMFAQVFYERLFAGAKSAEALRAAKLALNELRVGERGAHALVESTDQNRFAHPSYWAPFVLWGGG